MYISLMQDTGNYSQTVNDDMLDDFFNQV
jgi:hypothetical protein